MRNRLLVALLITLLLLTTGSEVFAAGKFVLAYWREMSCTEVGGCSGGGGTLFMRVWVFDEFGYPKPNTQILCTTSPNWWFLPSNGDRIDIPMTVSGVTTYGLKCIDNLGSTSDVTPLMTTNRWPNWGHNSYEMAFIHKSDASYVPIYDNSITGTVNTTTNFDTDAPCTGSIAYYGIAPLDWYSGNWALPGGGWGEHGQTFVATGNRLGQVEFHGVTPANGLVDWTVEIRDGGPNGAVIATKGCPQHYSQDPWCVSFPLSGYGSCPLVPGQTYFARFYRSGGLNAYYSTNDNYKQGQAYWRATSSDAWTLAPNPDIRGHITCVNYGTTHGKITGKVSAGSTRLDDALVTVNPGQANEVTVYTSGGGLYNLPPLPAGAYNVAAWKPGYSRVTQSVQITQNQTSTVDFTLRQLTNFVNNPGFESGDASWMKYSDYMTVASTGTYQVYSYEGSKHMGYIASGIGNKAAGIWQRLTDLSPGAEYTFSAHGYTQSYTGDPTYPSSDNCQVRLGVDPAGGTDPASPNVQWIPWQDHQGRWLPVWLKSTMTGTAATLFLEGTLKQATTWNKVAFDNVCFTTENVRTVSGPSVTNITPTSARVTWTTDVPSTSYVEYGPTGSYGSSVTDSSPVTSHSMVITGLDPGTLYNYRVTSTASGYVNGVSPNGTFLTTVNSGAIGDVKSPGDGASVGLVGKIVTAGTSEMGGCFYIEEIDRSSAIRVNTTETVSAGDAVSVAGILSTTGAEMVIDATGVSVTSSGNTPARALGCANASLGDVRSLLVRCWGTVSSGEGCFFICDGSSQPVKVITANLSSVPSSGEYAVVTGIASVDGSSSVIKPRNQQDLKVVAR